MRHLDFREGAQQSAPGSGEGKTRIPAGIRTLLLLTTSPYQPEHRTGRATAERIDRMIRAGWWIRSAHGRNYLLWRNGRTMKRTRLAVFVLPVFPVRMRDDEAAAFLAGELFKAELRSLGVFPPYPASLEDRMDDVVQSALADLGFQARARRLRLDAEEKLSAPLP